MVNQADMRSLEHLALFLHELEQFRAHLVKELEALELELRRTTHWLEHDVLDYWHDEHTRAHRVMLEAERNLSRCMSYVRADERRPCTEEKKRVQKAQLRHELCEQKIKIAKAARERWEQEQTKNRTRVEGCRELAESALMVAIHQLRGQLERLETYANLRSAANSQSPGLSARANSNHDVTANDVTANNDTSTNEP
jgi:hypothetical protein